MNPVQDDLRIVICGSESIANYISNNHVKAGRTVSVARVNVGLEIVMCKDGPNAGVAVSLPDCPSPCWVVMASK